MTTGAALSCPKCKRALDSSCWVDDAGGACAHCLRPFEFVPFPALRARRRVIRPQAVAGGGEASCFFHADNRAESVCEGCGRFVCAVCSVDFAGRPLCPACIATKKDAAAGVVKERVLYDGIAFGLALLPMLLWPTTLITAPAALGVVIVGWKKPASLVRRGRWRLWVAGLLAILQIGAWVFLGLTLFLK